MFFNKLRNQIAELQQRIVEVEAKNRTLEQVQDHLAQCMKAVGKLVKAHQALRKDVDVLLDLKRRKESDEPWIDFTGGDIDPEKGVELKFDWNDAFIDQLRAQGYKGITETELVGQYLLQLSNMIAVEQNQRELNGEEH